MAFIVHMYISRKYARKYAAVPPPVYKACFSLWQVEKDF
jgi:hypothetical protein